MRRVLRKIANNEEQLGDISTMADPTIIQSLQEGYKQVTGDN